MWNLVEPKLLRVEPLCGTLWSLSFKEWNPYVGLCGTSTFKSGTFIRHWPESLGEVAGFPRCYTGKTSLMMRERSATPSPRT